MKKLIKWTNCKSYWIP